MAKVYVVTAPDSVRGIYETWAECEAAVRGLSGARYQSVDSIEKAELMLGDGIALPPGLYAFTDGNAAGGVGVVLVRRVDQTELIQELAVTVREVFSGALIPGLTSAAEVDAALARLHNILAELAGLFQALCLVEGGSEFTLVHDYAGVGAWMQHRWKTKDEIVAAIIERSRMLAQERSLRVTYLHQRGHQSSWVGEDEFARWNARADQLATIATKATTGTG
jgi:ribonuclease HI